MVFLKKIKSNSASGFTLMEAMVTVAIIGIMSAVYLIDYRPTNQKIILDQAAAGIVADLRNAQNMAMNVKKFEGAIPQGGYGIKFNIDSPGTYIIYADCNLNSHLYDNNTDCGLLSNKAEKVSDRTLDSKVRITTALDIAFQPPSPIVWFDGTTSAISGVVESTIILQYGTTGATKTITINGYTGQISVSN